MVTSSGWKRSEVGGLCIVYTYVRTSGYQVSLKVGRQRYICQTCIG